MTGAYTLLINGQYSSWTDVKAGFPQESFLGPFFLNDLSNHLLSNPKLFADDTSLFSLVERN